MECLAVIACSVAVIFARLALMQDLNPVFWGDRGRHHLRRGALVHDLARCGWTDAPWVWASSFGGLFVLFIIQAILAANRRHRNR